MQTSYTQTLVILHFTDLLLPDVGVKEFTSVVAAAAELHTKL
jgi:hypothetical protein